MLSRSTFVFILSSLLLTAQAVRTTGSVDTVTLYRGQSLVTRAIVIEGKPGSLEIVVEGLPEQVVPTSLFAEAPDGVEVRAVRYRAMAAGNEPREDLRAIDQKLEELAERTDANVRAQDLANKRFVSLDSLERFTAPTAEVELAKGVLNAEVLERLVTFTFEQRKKASEELLALAKEAKEIDKQVQLLQRQRAELAQGSTKTVREAVLFLEKRRPEPATVRLSYLANGCGWSPAYNLRGTGDISAVEVEYSANIHQMTGEDWGGVDLTLSTATPTLNASAPGLAPFTVALGAAEPKGQSDLATATGKFRDIQHRRQAAQTSNAYAATIQENFQTAWAVNEASIACQAFELIEGREAVAAVLGTGATEGPSLSYPLGLRVSLPSRPDQQLVRIAAARLPSKSYHVALPVLTSLVYREAEVTNTSPLDLLGGAMSVYLDGRFVGRGELDTVARGQTFVVGFGADPQLKARREQADRSERIQGGNKQTDLKYRLVLENFKDTPVPVRVFDRLPHADRTEDLRVALGTMTVPLSDDPTYLRIERSKGILRWNVPVPAAAGGEKALILEYAYTLEHARNLSLSTPGSEQSVKAQQEFEQLQKERSNK